MDSYLARFGETLVKNDYAVIPIMAGTKRPPGWMSHEKGDPWSAVEPDIARVRQWRADKRLAGAGVGVNLGGRLFALDIDVLDPEMAAEILDWCEWNLPGAPPQRIGLAPKTLLLFRTETAIRKIASAEFTDAAGRKAQVEGLGEGEQFVAYAIHPDTKKPYTWPGADLVDTPAANLPLINVTQARALVTEFERLCTARGWPVKRRGSASITSAGDGEEDWTDSVGNGKTDVSIDELKKLLDAIPNDDVGGTVSFDDWLNAGMSLYHQTDGSEEGFKLWTDWSGQSSKHVQAECERRWSSFNVSNKDIKPLTARFLIKRAGGVKREKVAKQAEDLKARIEAAGTEEAIRAAAKTAKLIDLDPTERSLLVALIQKRFRVVCGASLPVGVVRDMIRFEKKQGMPAWLEPWVYVAGENIFYHRKSQVVLPPPSFDAMFSRALLSESDRLEGRSLPEKRPSDVALNVVQIPAVDRRIYLPAEEPTKNGAGPPMIDGQSYINTYTRANIPQIPANPTAQEIADLETVKDHCAWLIQDDDERHKALSWMAYPVQTRKRSRWALVLLGEEGSGKTFFFEMLGHVLGRQNVRTVGPKEVEKEFNGWMEGVQLVVFEEIKQHGHNRYDVLNSLKPIITNDYVSIRRMRADSYMVPNTANIMAYTNFADALPISEGDRRYMMIATSPTKAEIAAKGPEYFTELFDAMSRSAGMIHGWLLSMDLHPEFNPNGRAPMTAWKKRAIALTEREEVTLIRNALETVGGTVSGLSPSLLSTKILSDYLMDAGEAVPLTHTLNRALMDLGLTFIGRVKVKGVVNRFWSDDPARWSTATGEPRTQAIRDWLDDDL